MNIYNIQDKEALEIKSYLISKGTECKTIKDIDNLENLVQPFIIINGDGYMHNLTKKFIKPIKGNFAYVHIDAHHDAFKPISNKEENDDEAYQNFVTDIALDVPVYVASEFILDIHKKTDKKGYFCFDMDIYSGSFSFNNHAVQEEIDQKNIYLSIDLDALDEHVVHTLFPNKDRGIKISTIEKKLEYLSKKHNIVGVDICGFSTEFPEDLFDYTEKEQKEIVEKSLSNIDDLVRSIRCIC